MAGELDDCAAARQWHELSGGSGGELELKLHYLADCIDPESSPDFNFEQEPDCQHEPEPQPTPLTLSTHEPLPKVEKLPTIPTVPTTRCLPCWPRCKKVKAS